MNRRTWMAMSIPRSDPFAFLVGLGDWQQAKAFLGGLRHTEALTGQEFECLVQRVAGYYLLGQEDWSAR